jgi:hypothetical protein
MKTVAKNCRLACSQETLKFCQYVSEKEGLKIFAITEQAIREWCEKRGYDVKTILNPTVQTKNEEERH